MSDEADNNNKNIDESPDRRDFLQIATYTVGGVGAGLAVWPLIDSINPPADVLSLASSEIDISSIKVG